jgi:hypothetical protein
VRGRPDKAVGRIGTMRVGRTGTVQLGRGGFGPATVKLFFYFSNIFKSLQNQKFVYDSFELKYYETNFVG